MFIFNAYWDYRHSSQKFDHPHALTILRTLIEGGADSELIDQTHILVRSVGGPTEMFHYLQQHTLMSSGEISFIGKVSIASCFVDYYHDVQSQILMFSFLEDPNLQEKIALHRDHPDVEEFFWGVCRNYCHDEFEGETRYKRLDLIKKMISAGMSLHIFDKDHETMLQREIWYCSRRLDMREGEVWGLEMWLKFLIDLNVDLNTYGEVESSIYKKKRMAQEPDTPTRFLVDNFLGFKYGPRIEDWDLWKIEWMDKYAGDFWKLIENPLQAALANISIPGEWVD